MILGYALITVKPEHLDDYIQAFDRLRADVALRDPGTVRYDLHQRRDDPYQLIVIEHYEDDAALDLHMTVQKTRQFVWDMIDQWMVNCEYYFCNPIHVDGKMVA